MKNNCCVIQFIIYLLTPLYFVFMNINDLPIELKEQTIDNELQHILLINTFYSNYSNEQFFKHDYLLEIANYKLLAFYEKYEYSLIDITTFCSFCNIEQLLINCHNVVSLKYICNILKKTKYCYYDSSYLCDKAAIVGNLHLLKCLHINNFKWTVSTCFLSMFNGHLNCFKYLCKNNCDKFDIKQTSIFPYIYTKHYKCIKYAYVHGFKCTHQIINKFNLSRYTIKS